MELWELVARESIRDLVARYNANGDSGRLDAVVELFAPDATMELTEDGVTQVYEGRDGVRELLQGFKDRWARAAERDGGVPLVRHLTATLQIDVDDQSHARSRSYVAVVMAHGLDHWGRYLDDYVMDGERWLIARRRAFTDGRVGADRRP